MEDAYNLSLRILVEATRFPWLSAVQLALRLGLTPKVALQQCEDLVQRDLLRAVEQGLLAYPRTRYAPMPKTLSMMAEIFGQTAATVQRQLHLTPGRYWAMRLAMEMCQETMAVLGATALHVAASRDVEGTLTHRLGIDAAEFDLFIPRQHKTQEIYLHGKLVLRGAYTRVYYLLIDRGEGSVWQWYPQLKYLNQWADRTTSAEQFPPLLMLTTRAHRADALLELTRMAGSKIWAAASSDRVLALRRGLLSVAELEAGVSSDASPGWHTLMPTGQIMPVNPFDVPGMPDSTYRRSLHVLPSLSVARATPKTKATKEVSSSDQMPDLDEVYASPVEGQLLRAFEQLEERPYHVLTFLARNPGVPAESLAVLQGLTLEQADASLAFLEQAGLARTLKARTPVALWVATDGAMQLRLMREMQSMSLAKRYRFFRADHERRGMHTLATYRFFENLKTACAARSRAMRKLDTKPYTLNEGHIPYYALAAHESEYMAADWFVLDGQTHYWRPDGYGVLRAGEAFSRFWIEMDGTDESPSRHDPAVWFGKLNHLYDYLASQRWRLRYETQPGYLIVTTEVRNARHVHDALWSVANGRNVPPPQVYLATREAIQQRGAMGKVWLDINTGGPEFGYAFANVAPVAVTSARPRRKDMLADLQQAERLGLLKTGDASAVAKTLNERGRN